MRAVLVAILVMVSGCIVAQPNPTRDPADDSSTVGNDGGQVQTPTHVIVSGQLEKNATKHWANVSAYNPGPRTLGWTKSDCVRPVWVARLSGPPGPNLKYRPDSGTIGCPGQTGSMRPGEWINWTLLPASQNCTNSPQCENEWDGRLWDRNPPYAAPAGDYVWTFTFRYFQEPAGTDDPYGTAAAGGPGATEKTLVFNVTRT